MGGNTYIEENETSDQRDDDGGDDDASENVNVHESVVIVRGRANEIVKDVFIGR